MNIEEFNTFIKLCELKNFTKTAEALMMSQPTVSLHIKNLEQAFQTQLIQRSSKHVSITPTGLLLLERAKQLTRIIEQTKQDILEHHQLIQGQLKIGASFTIGEYILPMLLGQLKQHYPHIGLEILIGNTDEIVEKVKLFQVDVGLIEGKTDEKDIVMTPFMQDELVVIAAKHHPLAQKQSIYITDLQNEAWISREVGSGTRENLNYFLRSNGLKVKSIMTISSNQGIKETVIHGLGISLISKATIERDIQLGEIAILPLKQQLHRTLSYIYSPVMLNNRIVKSFIDELHEKWA